MMKSRQIHIGETDNFAEILFQFHSQMLRYQAADNLNSLKVSGLNFIQMLKPLQVYK